MHDRATGVLAAPVFKESGTKWGRLRGEVVPVGRGVGESGVPAVEVAGELVIEDSGADLQQEVRPAWCPPHLLFF